MFKKIAVAAGLAFLLLSGAVLSQSISVPQVSVINPTDLFQIIPKGMPVAGNVYATPAQITSQFGYYKSAPGSGFTFTYGNTQTYAAFAPSGTIAYGYVTFAPAPSDGARECLFTTNTITTLYLAANTSQTLNNAVTTLAANTSACYLYSASNTSWDRD
jgi:hypothetical protein